MAALRETLKIMNHQLFCFSKHNIHSKLKALHKTQNSYQKSDFTKGLINFRNFQVRNFETKIKEKITRQLPDKRKLLCNFRGLIQYYVKGTGYTLVTFSLFRKKVDTSGELSKEVLANIPKEVFRVDKPFKHKKHWFITRVVLGIWNSAWFCLRLLRVLCTFGPLVCLYPITYVSESFTVKWWDWLLTLMEYTGPTFIKLGQWAGTRRDLFSPEFCDMCGRLHSSTRQHAFYITKRKLRKAFGKRWRQIFMKIEKEPIGSGCIAQVHRAYMKADMIPDESIVDEVLSLEDPDEPDVDFAEGFEIIGFNRVNEFLEDIEDSKLEMSSATMTSQKTGKEMEDQQSQPEEEVEDSIIETGSGKILDPEKVTNPPHDSVEIVPQMPDNVSSIQSEGETLIPVAIKVLHPGVYHQVQHDLSILRFGARILQFLFRSIRWLSFTECVEEFADLMTRQIDLRLEAECLEQFIDNFEDNPNVRFPRPIWPYCKRDVLVETLEDGEPISNFLSVQDDTDDPELVQSHVNVKEKIASIGVDALLQMIFSDNFVHGDLHPGNILVQNAQQVIDQDENKLILVDIGDTVIVTTKPTENPIRLVLLDTGITTTLSDRDMDNFKDVFTAVVIGEGEKVAELMLKHSTYSDCKNVAGFKQELGDIVTNFRKEAISLGKVQVGDLLNQVFSTCSRHKVKMESNFASVLIAIFVLEGLGRSLDPELDILERAKPILLS